MVHIVYSKVFCSNWFSSSFTKSVSLKSSSFEKVNQKTFLQQNGSYLIFLPIINASTQLLVTSKHGDKLASINVLISKCVAVERRFDHVRNEKGVQAKVATDVISIETFVASKFSNAALHRDRPVFQQLDRATCWFCTEVCQAWKWLGASNCLSLKTLLFGKF